MDRFNVRTFVASLQQALSYGSRHDIRLFSFRGVATPVQRHITGFVLLVFGLTQIVYPMDLFAAGRTLPGTPPPDSFIQHQVNSVPALVYQIQHNLAVRRNYARHFGMPVDKIAGYMNNNLTIQTLRRPYKHVVYCVRPDGVFFTVKQTMPAGTKVFALKYSGRPVLKWKCGNPFTAQLPHPDSIVTFLRRTPQKGKKPAALVASKVEVVTPAETSAVVPTEAVLPSTEVVSSLPLTPASFVVPAGVVGGGTSLLPFLPLIPVLFAVGGGGGGGSNSTTGGGTTSTTGTTSTATTGTTTSTATTGTTGTTSTATTGTTGTTSTATTGTTETTGTTTSTATTGTTGVTNSTGTTATTGTTGVTNSTTSTTTTTSTATTGTTGVTNSTGTTATTGTTDTTGTTTTTGSVVPEPASSSTLGYAFLGLALLAFVSSVRRKRRMQE